MLSERSALSERSEFTSLCIVERAWPVPEAAEELMHSLNRRLGYAKTAAE